MNASCPRHGDEWVHWLSFGRSARSRVQLLVTEACRLNILDKGKPAAMRGRKAKDHRGAIRGGSLVAEGVDRSGPVKAGLVIPNQQLNDGEAAK